MNETANFCLIGTRFGDIEYADEDVVTFTDGMIGFPDARRFILLSHKENSPFRWLQSLDEPKLAFLVTDPGAFVCEYTPSVEHAVLNGLEIGEETPRLVFTTARIPNGEPNEMTLNLAAPIVVNATNRKARQIVLTDDAYTIRHRVFRPDGEPADVAAA